MQKEELACEMLDISGTVKLVDGVRVTSWRRAFFYLLRHEPAIVHFHNFSPRNLYLYSVLATRHKAILSFHNERFPSELRRYSAVEQRLFIRLLDSFQAVVVDSEPNRDLALKLGISIQRLHVIPEFIAPAMDEGKAAPLPVEIDTLRKNHRYLLATNAFQLAFHLGEDMYGIDLVIEATANLVRDCGVDAATVILLPNPGNGEYLEHLRNRINALEISNRCRIVTTPMPETTPLWRVSDIVIRATNTDGNSLTVLEALSCGTPVVASDCVARHPAVKLYRNRDLDSLTAAVQAVLGSLDQNRQEVASTKLEDNAAKLIELYCSLAKY